MRLLLDQRWTAILAVQFVTAMVPLSVLPFLFLHLQELTEGRVENAAFWTATAAAAPAIAAIIATPLWGRLAQGRSLASLMTATCLLSGASYALQGWAATPVVFCAARFLQGAAGSGIILLLAVERIRRGSGGGYVTLQQAFAAGCLIGPLLGGLAFEHDALLFLLLLAAASCVVLALISAIAFHRDPAEGLASGTAQVVRGTSRRNSVCILAATLGSGGAFGFAPFFAAWAMEHAGTGVTTTTIGAIHAAGWLAGMMVLPLWGRAIGGFSAVSSVRFSLAGSALTLGLLAIPGTILWIAALRILQGGIHAGLAPALYNAVSGAGHPERNIAAGRTALTLGQVLGPVVCGLALPWAGTNGVLLVAAALPLIGFLLLSAGYR